MSILHIQHRTIYNYTRPVQFGVHRLVLRPREGHRTRVLHHQITISPSAELTWLTDVHGNQIAYAEILERSDELSIINEITLELAGHQDEPAPPGRISGAALPLTFLQSEQNLVRAYLESVWTDEKPRLTGWLTGLPRANQFRSALQTAHWLVSTIHRQIKYRRREERGTQSPATTLSLGTGSCRDMATLAMEAVRAVGIPARFVSGYLNSAVSAAGLGSTHAWMECYFPDGGWRGFDATSGCEVGSQHIPTGVSVHPRGVMPVSGTFDSRTGRNLSMKVEITIRHEADRTILHA